MIYLKTLIILSIICSFDLNAHNDDTAASQQHLLDIIKNLLQDNEEFVKSHKETYFKPFLDHQAPRATVVACSDSRFHTHAIDKTPDNDLFFVRNIGNQLKNSEGSIEYGVRHLGTPLLIFIGHNSCGAVKAATSDYSKLSEPIRRELDNLAVPIKKEGPSEEEISQNVTANIHNQVKTATEKFAAEVTAGKLTIIGAVYDFKNEYKQGYGCLIFLNINGKTDPKTLKAFREKALRGGKYAL